MIDLSVLLRWLGIESADLGIEVAGLCLDSRQVSSKDVFIALNGQSNHGIDFAYQVQRAGACAILAETPEKGMAKPNDRTGPLKIPVIEIENLADKLGHLVANFYEKPSEKLDIIGITGTNGKTSCAWLLLQAWHELGIKGAYIGTLGYGTLHDMNSQNHTTPPALELQKKLKQFVDAGISRLALEVSSHALTLGRVNAIKFAGVALTNISRDHLDFHANMQEYAEAKHSLFKQFDADFCVINANDDFGKQWLVDCRENNSFSYGIDNSQAELNATDIELTAKGINFSLHYNDKVHAITSQLLGRFNVENLLLVIAVLLKEKYSIDAIVALIPKLQPVPGRINRVEGSAKQPLIIVDYAHTPDALKQVLLALKQHKAGKIWCIFGCGGNRDKGKRPLMGQIAEQLADNVIITDDNPRFEDAGQIVKEILAGLTKSAKVIHSRHDAIAYAISQAKYDDIILIAGKGHENYQLVNGHYHEFDDSVIAKQLLLEAKEKCA